MKKILFITMMCASVLNLAAQNGLFINGASLKINSGAALTVKGNLVNTGSSSLQNDGNLSVTGNITNNQTIPSSSGMLSFTGTTAQTLNGTSMFLANNIYINNAAGVTLNNALKATGTVSFFSGLLNATTNSIVFAAGSSVSTTNAPTDASHIIGGVIKEGTGAFIFPVGDAVKYQPVGVNLTANATGMRALYVVGDAGSGTFSAGGASPVPLLHYNKQEYWDLAPLSTATGTVTINWDNYKNAGIANVADLRVAHSYGFSWLNEGGTGTGTIAAGNVTGASLSTWSPFTLGSISAASTLPVKLIYFNGVHRKEGNELRWESADETGAFSYELERSPDNIRFASLKTFMIISAAGKQYAYSDAKAPIGINYYRLKIKDADGRISFSNIVKLASGNAETKTVYPNPATTYIRLSLADNTLLKTSAYITDATGRTVKEIFIDAPEMQINIESLSKTTYSIRFSDGTTLNFIKQ